MLLTPVEVSLPPISEVELLPGVPFHGVDETAAAFGRVRAAAAETGRSLVYSVAQTVAVGRDDAEAARRAEAIGQRPGSVALGGTVAQVVDTIGRFAEVGAERVYLQLFDLDDLDHLDLIAGEVVPQV